MIVFCVLTVFMTNIDSVKAQTDAETEAITRLLNERTDAMGKNIKIEVALINEGQVQTFGSNNKSSSVYEIGSVTKVFTTTLLAGAVKRGEVSLDAPISDYLPKTVKVPSRGGKQITLRHLAMHTSGLPRLPDNLNPKDINNPYADYTVEKMYEFISSYALPREIGEKYEYSNLGSGLLGHILSLRTKTSYEDLIKKRIAESLGMKNTTITLMPELKARLAPGHNAQGNAVPNWDFRVIAPAGAIRSDVQDVATFVSAAMNVKNSPLADVFAQMYAPRTETGTANVKVALGWHVLQNGADEIIWHNGGTGGYHSFIGFIKSKKRGVVVLTNSSQSIDDIGLRILTHNLTTNKTLKSVEVAPEVFDKYAGEYQLAPTFVITVSREGKNFYAQATNQPRFEIFAASETEFFLKQVEAKIRFVKNEKGEVTSLVLLQNGRETPGKKIK